MPVERDTSAVVTHGGAWVGVTRGFLDVAQRNTSIVCRGDERVPERVRSDSLVDPGATRDPSHDPRCAVPIETSPGAVKEDRPFASFPHREIDRPGGAWSEWDGHGLAAFAVDHQGTVAAFEAELIDVGADRFGDPQPVEREQRDQRMVASAREAGGDEHRADLVAVQTGRVGLVVEARSTDMHRWRAVK